MDGARLTAIYLDDHLAVLAGGVELVRRVEKEAKDDEIRAFLRELLPELRDDGAAATRLLRELGRQPRTIKQTLARIAVKGGRFKLNGNATGYSPLTRLTELEGLAMVLGQSRALWRAIERAGPESARGDAVRRAERVEERLERAEELRLSASEVVFSGSIRRL